MRTAAPREPGRTARLMPRRVQLVCDFYISEVHAGVVDYARTAGWSLFDGKCYIPTLAYTEECDGILAVATMPELAGWLRAQSRLVVRLLCSDMELPFPAVEPDSVGIGARGAEHFLSHGSPNCAFFTA